MPDGRTRTCENNPQIRLVDLLRRYWNRSDLLEQLRKVAVIMAEGGVDRVPEINMETVACSRGLRDRLSSDDVQAMIDLYRLGVTARRVAEKFGVSLRSVKRLLRQHGVHR